MILAWKPNLGSFDFEVSVFFTASHHIPKDSERASEEGRYIKGKETREDSSDQLKSGHWTSTAALPEQWGKIQSALHYFWLISHSAEAGLAMGSLACIM